MTKYLKYDEIREGKTVWQYDDLADNFYFILRGQISVQEPNHDIADWDWAYDLYTKLKKWMKEEFSHKLRKVMQVELIKLKMTTDLKVLSKLSQKQ